MSGDSPDLEALFDSIASAAAPAPEKAASKPEVNDTPELESLFDTIANAVAQEDAGSDGECPQRVFSQLGQMTRGLHNLLRELGYDKTLEQVAQAMPDNRDRLNYIAAMTAQAAERTLNAAEAAQPMQNQMGDNAAKLAGQWDKLFGKQLGVGEFKELVADTRAYLKQVPQQTEATNAKLMEIIIAQDFQDLTGQVIRKVLEAAQNLESQLLALLIEATPEDKRQAVDQSLLNGPVINAAGRSDVVTSQEQVDDLLESLGF